MLQFQSIKEYINYRKVADMTKTEQFLARIGMDPKTGVSLDYDFLGQIQSRCVCMIAYENLDILAGKPLSLEPEDLFDKIVIRGRGGYCFELNGLLTHCLREMGFRVSERFARFLRGMDEVPMRRHRVTIVTLPEGDYLCDIGVGQIAPRLPLKVEAGLLQEQNGEIYKFERDTRHGWVLWEQYHGAWREYICFADDAVYDVDFLQPNFFCEAHPDSVFNKKPMLAIKTADGRCTIDGCTYKVFRGEELIRIEENLSAKRMEELLATVFRLKNTTVPETFLPTPEPGLRT